MDRNDTPAPTPDAMKLPLIDDLAGTLRFAPEQGHIWLAGRRMVLLHARGLGILRREVIDAVGPERARAIFTRQGYDKLPKWGQAALWSYFEGKLSMVYQRKTQ